MKNIFTLLFISIVGLSACNERCINGSGRQVTQNRSVTPFTEIETGGSLKIVLKQDSVQKVSVLADDNIQEHIKTRVSGNRLTIDMESNFCDAGSITVYVSGRDFQGVQASGSVEIVGDGKLNTRDFHLDLSGDSKVNLDLNAENLTIRSSGSSQIQLKGQARSNRLDLSGAGEISAFDFVVSDYFINTSGASECKINVLNNLNIESSGASEIEYKGNPKQVNNNQSGASSVKKVQ